MTARKHRPKRPSKAAEPEQVEPQVESPEKQEAHGSAAASGIQSEDPRWTVSAWKGMPNYECRYCAFATVDVADAITHFDKFHSPPDAEERIVNTGLVNADGSEIMRVEPVKE